MDKTIGQGSRSRLTSVEQGAATRAVITEAAGALIAEVGWGQVTTRAIAMRADVPHGAVSYHFQGKEDLLRQAAIAGTRQALAQPLEAARHATGVHEVLDGTFAWFTDGGLNDPTVVLLLETLRQSSRDPLLRAPIAEMLRAFRKALTDLARADQEKGDLVAGVSPSGTAALVAGLFDGLLLHLLLDPELDLHDAAGAVHTLLRGG
ncbi:TetR/AcrR family transcriptional regulator [Actinomadura rubrisoli]|uniref:TetR/AcrR family transcriptional regulator n=1 Tax=Actinomadura rubrisoli TaxID=2530368 RepID=A0A4R5B328_9ACTN|nr:TetR/AcrR family transcriptional regulator [Actinomadura rubrisoli]TDD80538.1 TetR/AcrR family transcriptional regulator [Actinomadura rubrisoli]